MSQVDGVTSYSFLCRDLATLDLTKPARNGCQRVGKFAFDLLLGFEAAVSLGSLPTSTLPASLAEPPPLSTVWPGACEGLY